VPRLGRRLASNYFTNQYGRPSAETGAPITFLHGGPGVPDMKGDARYFGRLAGEGFDVYDQVGRGRSSRLDDPRAYTLERDVSDLEEIRATIDAEQVILIGHSYGGTLAAAYAASHPGRVAKMVLSSPGDSSPSAGARRS
jgi:proline iminopeptidase